jgi:adenosylcobinamide kinase/adenosylcobinamide-phosphate guanylyltransferase
MGEIILILGRARSGKSSFAQELAQQIGGDSVLYVATAQAGDEEMRQRIERHQQSRPAGWRTLEAQRNVGQAILQSHADVTAVLIDCITLLTSNRLVEFRDAFAEEADAAVTAEIEKLVQCAQTIPGTLIIVSNEVGMGVVPAYPMGRAYRDLLGKANQVLAKHAEKVYVLIAGLPMQIKGG